MASWLARSVFGGAAAAIVALACSDLGDLSGGEDPPDAGEDRKIASPDASESDSDVTCEPGKTACGSLCSDVTNDAQNCGRCDHDCLGAKCEAGRCQPFTLVAGLNIPQGIALDNTDVYFTVYGSGDVMRVAKTGGSPVTITTDTTSPHGIALDLDGTGAAKRIAWGERRGTSSQLLNCALPGCTVVTKVPATEDVRSVASAGGIIYYTQSTTTVGSIRKIAYGSAIPTVILEPEPGADAIFVRENFLLVAKKTKTGAVRRMTTGGGGAIDLIPTLDNPSGVITDGTSVFAAVNGGSQIAKCPLLGCTGSSTFALATYPHEIVIDDTNVYWSNGLANGGSIAYCPIAGCPDDKPIILVPDQKNPYGIAVDDKAVYYTTSSPSGALMKIAKP